MSASLILCAERPRVRRLNHRPVGDRVAVGNADLAQAAAARRPARVSTAAVNSRSGSPAVTNGISALRPSAAKLGKQFVDARHGSDDARRDQTCGRATSPRRCTDRLAVEPGDLGGVFVAAAGEADDDRVVFGACRWPAPSPWRRRASFRARAGCLRCGPARRSAASASSSRQLV